MKIYITSEVDYDKRFYIYSRAIYIAIALFFCYQDHSLLAAPVEDVTFVFGSPAARYPQKAKRTFRPNPRLFFQVIHNRKGAIP